MKNIFSFIIVKIFLKNSILVLMISGICSLFFVSCKIFDEEGGDEGLLPPPVLGKAEKNVWVCGNVHNGNYFVAKYWNDGKSISLTDGTKDGYANSIFVSGGDVYVAGWESNGSTHVAKYWKNGIAVNLTDGTKYAEATSIFVKQ